MKPKLFSDQYADIRAVHDESFGQNIAIFICQKFLFLPGLFMNISSKVRQQKQLSISRTICLHVIASYFFNAFNVHCFFVIFVTSIILVSELIINLICIILESELIIHLICI